MRPNCFIIIGQALEPQAIYYYEKPSFVFQKPTFEGHVQVIPSKDPIWNVIAIEFPKQVLEHTKQWFTTREARDLKIGSEIGGNMTEVWEVKSAKVVSYGIQRSRVIALKVVNANLIYTWARRL